MGSLSSRVPFGPNSNSWWEREDTRQTRVEGRVVGGVISNLSGVRTPDGLEKGRGSMAKASCSCNAERGCCEFAGHGCVPGDA